MEFAFPRSDRTIRRKKNTRPDANATPNQVLTSAFEAMDDDFQLIELPTIAAMSVVQQPFILQRYEPPPLRPPTPDRSIEAQMRAFQEVDETMTESERKRARTETPPLPTQCLRPVERHDTFASPILATDLPHRRSIYVGVNWDQRFEKWKARIMIGGKMRHLGYFHEEADAAKKYDELASTTPGKPINFPGPGQIQAVKKKALVKRTDLEDAERLRGHEWLTKGLLGKYDYSEASRHVENTPAGWTSFDNIPKDAVIEARYVAQLIENVIFQARQEANSYFEKIHQVSADLMVNPHIRYAAVKQELTPSKVVSMDSKALLDFKQKNASGWHTVR